MKARLYCVVFLGAVIFGICNGTKLNSDEKEAQQFANETSEKMFKFFDKLRDDYLIDDDDEYNIESRSILNEARFLVEIVRQAKEFDFKNFKDKQLKYAFENIAETADEYIIGGEQYLGIVKTLWELGELDSEQYYDCFKGCDGNNSSDILASDIKKILATSNNPEELQFYWNQLREARAEWAKENLTLTLNGLKDAATLTDKSPVDFWLREYNVTEMENLMNEIQPLYMELHAFVRNGLQKKYGDSIVQSDGLIPYHLFEQVIAQAWTNGSIIEEIFPHESLPPVESVLQERFKTMELYEIADGFYQKLGFSELPHTFWMDHIKMKKSNSGDLQECSPYVHNASPNIYLEFCEKMNFEMFLEAYSDMGKLHYAKEMTGLPAYFFFSPDLEYAFGKAAILSTSTHHNLKAIGMIREFNFTEEVEMKRLLRKGIQSLLKAPVDFVHVKLMAGLLSGTVELKEVNTKYWELMNKYVGVKPPMNYEAKPDVPDMPFSFYDDMNENIQSIKFDSEIMSYQMYKKFCELGGKYPKEPLHLCDMHGTKAVGDLLKNTMRLGISKPFIEVLATIFPENPRANSDGILEYFSPLKKFLVEMNTKANVKPGWKHSH